MNFLSYDESESEKFSIYYENELENLTKYNETELKKLSENLKNKYKKFNKLKNKNLYDADTFLYYLNFYLYLKNQNYTGENINELLTNIENIYEEKLKEIEDEIKKRTEMSSEEDNQITDTAISNIMDKKQYDDVSEYGQGIKKRKKTKGKKTQRKTNQRKKNQRKKI